MPVINITQDQMERFQKIRKSRPQDSKAHETFNYLLRVFEEREQMVLAPHAFAANIAQNREPIVQSPDALYAKRKEAERIREIELNRERELSPTRSKLYSITEVDKP